MSDALEILLVSDFPSDSEGVERLVREVAGTRRFELTRDTEAALAFIELERPEIVIGHLRGGAHASAQFLGEVWKQHPRSARFLIASSADPETLARCVLGCHQFIPKPLSASGLKGALERADAIKEYVRSERVQSVVSRMRTLPSRPSLYIEVMRALRSDEAEAGAVAALISKDLGISTKLIQLVNSPAYALNEPVGDVKAAILLLGFEVTGSVVLSIEAFAKFDKLKPLYFSIDRVWKHSLTVAEMAREICQLTGHPEQAASAYTAGLLHDIGKLALAENFETEYQDATKLSEKEKLPLHQVEEQFFGANHSETGAYLLALWGLPLPVVDAVAKHHAKMGVLGASFSAAMVLHLTEELMSGVADPAEVIKRYPTEAGLQPFTEKIRQLLPTALRHPKTEAQPGGEPAKTAGGDAASPKSDSKSPKDEQKGLRGMLKRFFG